MADIDCPNCHPEAHIECAVERPDRPAAHSQCVTHRGQPLPEETIVQRGRIVR